MDLIFWDLLLLYQVFFSLQVKRSLIISNKHGITELSLELLNDLRLKILGNKERSREFQNFIEL